MFLPRPRNALTALSIALLALAGCEDGRVRPPRVDVRIVHAAPNTAQIEFRREQRTEAQLEFRGASSGLRFDEDNYDFNVYVAQPGNQAPVLAATFTQQLSAGNTYLYVLTGVAGLVAPIVVATPVFESTTDTRAVAVHAASELADVDVFLEPPDADLGAATPLGTAAFGAFIGPSQRAAGDLRLTVTRAGAVDEVLFSSATFPVEAGADIAFVIVGDAGDGVAPFSVVGVGATAAVLFDRGVQSGVQVVNAAADGGARDIFVDDDYTAPLVASLPYTGVSELAEVAPGDRTLSVTPAANPGVVEDEIATAAVQGQRFTAVVAGAPGSVSLAVGQDDNRRLAGNARIRFVNGANLASPLEIFLVTPGTDIANIRSPIVLAAPGVSQRSNVPPGDYELYFRNAETDVVVNGPTALSLTEGLFSVLAVNGDDGSTVDIVLLEDFE